MKIKKIKLTRKPSHLSQEQLAILNKQAFQAQQSQRDHESKMDAIADAKKAFKAPQGIGKAQKIVRTPNKYMKIPMIALRSLGSKVDAGGKKSGATPQYDSAETLATSARQSQLTSQLFKQNLKAQPEYQFRNFYTDSSQNLLHTQESSVEIRQKLLSQQLRQSHKPLTKHQSIDSIVITNNLKHQRVKQPSIDLLGSVGRNEAASHEQGNQGKPKISLVKQLKIVQLRKMASYTADVHETIEQARNEFNLAARTDA